MTQKPVAVKIQIAKDDQDCGPEEISLSMIYEEIKNNLMLKSTNYVIPL